MSISAGLGLLFAKLLVSALVHHRDIWNDNFKKVKQEGKNSFLHKKKYGL